jgi:predicted DNA-binding transcriptional regulator YafY
MNRIDRIAAILIQLQSKKIVKAQDIADRFNISLRTVYRDVNTLNEAGVPIIGEAGVGYSIAEGYRLPPVMFTVEEATAFLTAEKLIEKLTDKKTFGIYQSALFKIKAILRSSEKDYIDNLQEHIAVLESRYLPRTERESSYIQEILNSIVQKNVAAINYSAIHTNEPTKRNIEPVGIFFMAGHWYLIAYCQLRKDYRNFRVDRIKTLQVTTLPFQKQHPSLTTYLNQVTKKERELHKVVMNVNKRIIKYFGEQKYYNGFVSEKDLGDQVEMTFLAASPEGFARWYLMFGDDASIISPQSIKTRVKEIATAILKKVK